MVKIYILCIIAWSSICVTFPESIPGFGICNSASYDLGRCVAVQYCDYIKKMIPRLGVRNSSRHFQYVQQSGCGEDDKQTELFYKTLVCCSKKFMDGDVIPANDLPQKGQCGTFSEEKIHFKIVGGTKAKLNEFPWMALLEYRHPDSIRYHCHGALINSRYVITAAHCVAESAMKTYNMTLVRVRLGEYDTKSDPDCNYHIHGNYGECANGHVDINVESAIAHELYDSKNWHYDIGLIRLADYVRYTKYISPICLPLGPNFKDRQFVDRLMQVAGWGRTSADGSFSQFKLKATVKGWPLEDCQKAYSSANSVIDETQLCAGGEENIDECLGDAGGPLMLKMNLGRTDTYYAVGINSYGTCGRKDVPGVYTKLARYIDWIQDKLEP